MRSIRPTVGDSWSGANEAAGGGSQALAETALTRYAPQNRSRWQPSVVLAILAILLIDTAQRITPDYLPHWHYILHRLYYLPIIAAGLSLGWWGGLIGAVLSGASYEIHSLPAESPDAKDLLDRYLEIIVFCLVGTLSGILSDREKRARRAVEMTARRLADVYQELQNNVEHVKRAARMSALGHLSAGLAHEIRNPLASIEGAASIVQHEPDSQSRRAEFLEIIQKECRRLNRLVTNFLGFARPRAPELYPADIGQLIDSLLLLLSQTAAKGLTIEKHVMSGLRPLPCDAEQLKQVLLNLALNSMQAMERGGRILIAAAEETGTLVIRVQDQGPGIPESDVDSIFDPFFTTKQTGTGLGLPVAYQIVAQHGGELLLEKNGRQGACFAVRLPYERGSR